MAISVLLNGQNFQQKFYDNENEFEKLIIENAVALFGNNAIYVDLKQHIQTSSLGGTIPDGFLIDLADLDNPEFYLVEVELQRHDFFKHIFPQITKFFAFYRNQAERQKFIDTIFSIFEGDSSLSERIKSLIKEREVYKFLKDTLEGSQNILIIIDGPKLEFEEIINTYTDTWGKLVKVQIVNHFQKENNNIVTLEPPFQDLEFSDAVSPFPAQEPDRTSQYTEDFHLENCDQNVKDIYSKLKQLFLDVKDTLRFNPTKSYIGVAYKRQFAYIQPRKKKIRIVVIMPENKVRETLKSQHHNIISHSESAQKYWGGSNSNCAVDISDTEYFDEIKQLLENLVLKQEED